MTPLTQPEIESYAERRTKAPDAVLRDLAEVTLRTMPSPHMQVGPVEGALLRLLVRLVGARRVLEIGTFTGYSALMMAEGLPDHGELITCDIDPAAADVARRFFARSPHGRKIRLVLGPARETLRSLEGPFDLVFLDADKESYPNYLETVLPLMRSGSLLVADNALWSGRVLAPEDDAARAIDAFNRAVCDDPRLENVLLTVRDGIMLARKR